MTDKGGHPCAGCGRRATGELCRACRGKQTQMVAAKVLAPDDRALIAMRDDDRLTYAAIARRLGVTRPAVQVRLNRARTRQRLLAKEME